MMPVLPGGPGRRTSTRRSTSPCASEHGFRHTASIHSTNVETITRMARAMNCSIFVANGPELRRPRRGRRGLHLVLHRQPVRRRHDPAAHVLARAADHRRRRAADRLTMPPRPPTPRPPPARSSPPSRCSSSTRSPPASRPATRWSSAPRSTSSGPARSTRASTWCSSAARWPTSRRRCEAGREVGGVVPRRRRLPAQRPPGARGRHPRRAPRGRRRGAGRHRDRHRGRDARGRRRRRQGRPRRASWSCASPTASAARATSCSTARWPTWRRRWRSAAGADRPGRPASARSRVIPSSTPRWRENLAARRRASRAPGPGVGGRCSWRA